MISIYTDGSCLKNPGGPGGFSSILIKNDKVIKQSSGNMDNTTNNQMEIMAVLNGIQTAIQCTQDKKLTIYSDSAYVINAFKQKWFLSWQKHGWTRKGKELSNRFLWMWIYSLYSELIAKGYEINFIHVKGHSGIKYNEMADKLAFKEACSI
ncbi:MAG: ribonuclease H family protein [archaeon]